MVTQSSIMSQARVYIYLVAVQGLEPFTITSFASICVRRNNCCSISLILSTKRLRGGGKYGKHSLHFRPIVLGLCLTYFSSRMLH